MQVKLTTSLDEGKLISIENFVGDLYASHRLAGTL